MSAPVAEPITTFEVDLERSPVCEVITQKQNGPMVGQYTERTCALQAVWVVAIPCCGGYRLLCCERHHDSMLPWSCRKCGNHVPDESIKWVRL